MEPHCVCVNMRMWYTGIDGFWLVWYYCTWYGRGVVGILVKEIMLLRVLLSVESVFECYVGVKRC